jgi:hypothetical protein
MFVSMLGNKPGCEPIEFTLAFLNSASGWHIHKEDFEPTVHQFPDGTKVGRDLYCAFLARFVQQGRLDAIQAAKSWTGAKAFLRVASDGFEPARGRGFALRHAVLGVRAGRSKNSAECTREAANAGGVAHLAAVRVPQSGAVGTPPPSGGGSFAGLKQCRRRPMILRPSPPCPRRIARRAHPSPGLLRQASWGVYAEPACHT